MKLFASKAKQRMKKMCLEVIKVILVQRQLADDYYQQKSDVLYYIYIYYVVNMFPSIDNKSGLESVKNIVKNI